VFLPITQQEELIGWHPSGVTRKKKKWRIKQEPEFELSGVNFSEILIKAGKENLDGVSGEFELSEFRSGINE